MRNPLIALTILLLLATSAPADLVTPQAFAPRILVPAAGNAAGANGTYFRSDIQVANLRNAPQRVAIYWLPLGTDGTAIAPRFLELGASRGFVSGDFVGSALQQSGIGSIEFVAVNENGQFDPDGRLQVTSRIWTNSPDGDEGTLSQSFPSIVLPGNTSRTKTIFGMRRSADFRVNVGISNPSTTTHRFRVTARISTPTIDDSEVFEIEVPPRAMMQRQVTGLDASGVVQVLIENLTAGTATDWQAWASTIDNFSGDAWSEMAFPTTTP
jgi:hypothetical protein